jgi:hypothetical protein
MALRIKDYAPSGDTAWLDPVGHLDLRIEEGS